MEIRLAHLLHVVLLIGSFHGTVAQEESICVGASGLQVLDKSISEFHCLVNETIHALNCSGRGIPALPRTEDEGVPTGIEIFDFSNNKIKCLPKINNTRASCSVADCHAGCLLELHLQNNEIDYLHDEVFLDLTCLTVLDLSHNSLTNQTIKRHHFFRQTHLRHLDLHGNPLHTLPDNVLISTHLSHLHTLNLSFCQLEKIGEVAIDDFFELEVLDLSNNQLSRLSSSTFQGLVSLRILDLRWNRLVVIDKDTFGDMRELRELRLDHNKLFSISDLAFHRQAAVESLGLLENRFTSIPYSALFTLKKLRSLSMSHNPIDVLQPENGTTPVQELQLDYLIELREVEDNAFSAFPRLSKLSLRYCGRLTSLPPNAFRGSSSHLSEVQLDHNGLQVLPQSLLPWGNLSWLTLHGNRWHCDCRLGWATGHPLGNTTISCEEPLKLRGQTLQSLQKEEMDCTRPILVFQVIVGLALTLLFLTILALLLARKSRRRFCWCLRGEGGRYVTVFTKEKGGSDTEDKDPLNGTCGEGDVDDLDLGNGERGEDSGYEEGRVTILMKSFRSGYRRLAKKDTESTQDLTSAGDV